jgi:hypothetical protein
MHVLTSGCTATCGHALGSAKLGGPSQHKLTIGGVPALVVDDASSTTFAGCPPDNSNTGHVQCKKVTGPVSGASLKLKVGGKPVLLAELLKAATDGKVPTPGVLTATEPQVKLTSV